MTKLLMNNDELVRHELEITDPQRKANFMKRNLNGELTELVQQDYNL